jgi:hypothetical protein
LLDGVIVPCNAFVEDRDRNGLLLMLDIVIGKSIDSDGQKEKDKGAGKDNHVENVIAIQLHWPASRQ